MKIRVKIDPHAFCREKLLDTVFEEESKFGILPPEFLIPLRNKKGEEIVLDYSMKTTSHDIIEMIKCHIWEDYTPFVFMHVDCAFECNKERYYISDGDSLFINYLHIIDPADTGKIVFSILVSCDAGEVYSEHPLRFYVNSRERGKHNGPHIHVRDIGNNYSASISIENGEVYNGNLPLKYKKLAKEVILSNQEFFYYCWNTKTDGLYVDINKH